jgi:hypothetical protein
MQQSRLTFVLACLVFIAGCASAPPVTDRKFAKSNVPSGYALVSLTKTGSPINMMQADYKFQSVDGGGVAGELTDGVFFQIELLSGQKPPIPLTLPRDYLVQRENPYGVIRLVELPAGEYQVFNFSASLSNGYVTRRINGKVPDVKFSITPGKIVYLGNFNLEYSLDQTVRFNMTDEYERDMALFRKRFPEDAKRLLKN